MGYGLWGIGGWTGGSDAEGRRALDRAVALGCTFFDSAWDYGKGKSDRILGELLRDHRDRRLFAASKVPPLNDQWPASPDDSYRDVFPEAHVREYAAKIRAALGGAPIDLLQLHVWDDSWADAPEFARTVQALKRDGIIRWFGLSLNRWEPWNGIRAIETGLVDAVQVIYNIFDQAPEDELFPACRKADVGVIARVPLDEGSLAGNLTIDTRFPDDDWRSKYFGPENLVPTVERVERIKAELPDGLGLPEVALRFILGAPEVSTTIAGMRTVAHVEANVAASDKGPLPPDVEARLRAHRWDRKPAAWSD
ncbi:MAG: aldo/keto reductase [Gemmatimonadales bacterium]